jgi:hypothetical protein
MQIFGVTGESLGTIGAKGEDRQEPQWKRILNAKPSVSIRKGIAWVRNFSNCGRGFYFLLSIRFSCFLGVFKVLKGSMPLLLRTRLEVLKCLLVVPGNLHWPGLAKMSTWSTSNSTPLLLDHVCCFFLPAYCRYLLHHPSETT